MVDLFSIKTLFVWKLKNFSGGTIGVFGLDFTGKIQGWGVSIIVVVCSSAAMLFALLPFCSFLLLDDTLYHQLWCNYLYWFTGDFICIGSIYTYNVYYVTRALILKLWYNIPNFYFTGLNGHSDGASLKALCIKGFGGCV